MGNNQAVVVGHKEDGRSGLFWSCLILPQREGEIGLFDLGVARQSLECAGFHPWSRCARALQG